MYRWGDNQNHRGAHNLGTNLGTDWVRRIEDISRTPMVPTFLLALAALYAPKALLRFCSGSNGAGAAAATPVLFGGQHVYGW